MNAVEMEKERERLLASYPKGLPPELIELALQEDLGRMQLFDTLEFGSKLIGYSILVAAAAGVVELVIGLL